MSLVCALTGEVPEEGVFCEKSGFIFEKRIIKKHIEATGTCPISGLPLTLSDLVDIKTNLTVKPRPLSASSIPGLLSCLQNEWDSITTESFMLKSHLEQVRKQLSHALYQHDAATRVIARLIRERDAARENLHKQQQQLILIQQSHPTHASRDQEIGVSEVLQESMQAMARQLLAARKKRVVVPFFATPEAAESLKCSLQLPLHSSSVRGVLRVKLASAPESSTENATQTHTDVVTCSSGMDGSVVFFDLKNKKQLAKIQAHQKPCRDVLVHKTEPVFISASDDKICKIWRGSSNFSTDYKCMETLRGQSGELTSLSMHPMAGLFACASADKSWAFIDANEGKYLHIAKQTPTQYSSLGFHPDGMILGCGGSDGKVYIWDLKALACRASLSGHTGKINDVAFSENGYYLATAGDDGTLRLWDLRKSLSFQAFTMSTYSTTPSSPDPVSCTCVKFDESGAYVAAGSGSGFLQLFNFQSRATASPVHTLFGHTDVCTDLQFVEGNQTIISSSMDKTVRVWTPSTEETA